MSASRWLSTSACKRPRTHWRTSLTDQRATSVMVTPERPEAAWAPNRTALACAFSRVPSHVGQASSTKSSTSVSAKLCSRPRSLSSRTESSKTWRCSRERRVPVPTQSGHQPCLLLYENRRGSSSG